MDGKHRFPEGQAGVGKGTHSHFLHHGKAEGFARSAPAVQMKQTHQILFLCRADSSGTVS